MLIILDSTSRTLKAKMDMAAMTTNCSVVVAYADNSGTTFTEGAVPSVLNGTTSVTILPAPAAGVRRIVKSICIFNPDAETHTTTLIFNDNTTEYPITRLTLASGGSWSSDDQTGVNVGGAITDGDKGDISVSSGGTTWTIDNGVVGYGKIQTVTNNRLLGRSDTAGGSVQEIIVGTGLSLSTGTLTATSGSMVYPGAGVAVSTGSAWGTSKTSPSGDIVGTTDSQVLTNKTISGASNTLSNINLASQVTGTLPVANGGTGATTAGGALTSLGAYAASNPSGYTSNTGTVTGVTGTSPVASSGGTAPAISLASGYGDTQNPYGSKTANSFLAAPNGTAAAPTFRAIVAADIPTLNQNTTGTASNVSGTVAVANGGTGLTSTPSNGQLDIGNGTGFTRATLTAGSNITITNGAGAITIASTASGGGAPQNHIYGLELRWNPTNGTTTNDKRTVRISPGGAYVPAASAVLTVSSPVDVLISTITAKAWYYLYLYGNDAVEASTTAPVFYYGRASHKTGDNSRRFIGAVQADWNATPLLTPFYATCENDYVIYNHIGFDHRLQWRILSAGQATAVTNFNLRSTTTSNLNAELVPEVVYKSYIAAFVLGSGSLAGIGPRGLFTVGSPSPFDMAVYTQIPNVVFPFLTPATVPIDPSDGRTSYYVVGTSGLSTALYLDATGCEYWR